MRIGLFQGIVDPPPYVGDQVQAMVDAEADGFDSVWTTETIRAEALTVIALAGQRTERIEFGTGVVPMHPWLHRHPLTFAQHALTTQAATGGRLTLGIGATRTPTGDASGMDLYHKPVTHMREFVTILRCLVDEGAVDISGEIFSVTTTLQVPGASPFPILMAALGPQMLQVAGELTDGTVTWMVGPKTLESHIVPRLSSAAERVGRPPPRVAVGAPVAVTDDAGAGREAAASYFGRYGRLPSYRRMLDIEGVEGPEDVAIFGDEAEVERQVRELATLGATDLLASVFPVGDDSEVSTARTRELLASLVGKV